MFAQLDVAKVGRGAPACSSGGPPCRVPRFFYSETIFPGKNFQANWEVDQPPFVEYYMKAPIVFWLVRYDLTNDAASESCSTAFYVYRPQQCIKHILKNWLPLLIYFKFEDICIDKKMMFIMKIISDVWKVGIFGFIIHYRVVK